MGEENLPDTNGTVVTYASNAANGGNDFDIWYQNVDGADPSQDGIEARHFRRGCCNLAARPGRTTWR